MLIKRRTFLQTTALASASLLLPKFLMAMRYNNLPNAGKKVLVVVQLTGGNDGLNTVVPYSNDLYYSSRPNVALAKSNLLTLNDQAALHPQLTAFRELYDQGQLSILNNVGYPNPNRSHFRSMDIWESASASDEIIQTGWLGRYLDKVHKQGEWPTQIIETDDILSLALKGENLQGIALRNPRKLYTQAQENYFKKLANQEHHEHQIADYLYKLMGDTLDSTNYILERLKQRTSAATYPNSAFGRNLKNIASLIRSDINTSVYYISLGSFDTHVNQQAKQAQLFKDLNDSIKVFTDDLKASGRFEDVMIMTFSEFGRRVKQNASQGTDHGTANNMFLISGSLKKAGLYNDLPDLKDLQDGDLKYKIDFRDVYGTILKNWLESNTSGILTHPHQDLGFV